MLSINSVKKSYRGIYYFILGWKLIFTKGIKRYVFLPLLINILLLGAGFWWLESKLRLWVEHFFTILPTWLHWLDLLIFPLIWFSILLGVSYTFTLFASWVASPVNGLLAEKVEEKLKNHTVQPINLWALIKDIPRTLYRELQKLCYYLPRLLILFLLHFIPILGQTLAPILLFLFLSWMLAIQYSDYIFDNHKIPFKTTLNAIKQKRFTYLQFGILISLFLTVPIVNLFIMPVAICGATALKVEEKHK